MNTKSILIALALGVSTCLLQAQPDNQQPGEGGQRPGRRQGGGPGGAGGGMRGGDGQFHALPPFVAEQLNLTDDQKAQLEKLDKEVKAKLDNILTDEQKTKLKDMRERFRSGGGRGPGGPGGGQGGQGRPPGGQQRPPSDDK
jgi:Spy/CpxP family protein refolding chaperone